MISIYEKFQDRYHDDDKYCQTRRFNFNCIRIVYRTVDKILRTIFNTNKSFGGLNVILVGDFDQKMPVKKGGSLAQALVNWASDDPRRGDNKEMYKNKAAKTFSKFKKYNLESNHRVKKGETKLGELLNYIQSVFTSIIIEYFYIKIITIYRTHVTRLFDERNILFRQNY